ncbi:hypothetical protein F2Y51_24500 [Phocaeicola dorei]|uniref:Uncharacterized protein n=1 Tax=Phocaeicola dorei TaxID=357276 RepID=A0A6A1I811_9BACT|nr:hypothetical protein [Phocaeicola dorei]KAA5399269.1 hypothetical protein F2Y51_24500 [Phocaeicola dorei]
MAQHDTSYPCNMTHLIATTRYIFNRTVLKLIPLLSKTGISKPIKPRLDEPAGAYSFSALAPHGGNDG